MYRVQIDEGTFKALRRVGYENDVSITSDGKFWISVTEEFYNNLGIWNNVPPEAVIGIEIMKCIVNSELSYLKDL